MRYTGIQPQYFPRLHYFARILNTDIFMLRDDAQFVRKHKYPDGRNDKSYQAHTPIKQSYGRDLLSIPIKHKEQRFLPIYETKLSYDTPWVNDHLMTIKIAYGKSKNFDNLFPKLEELFRKRYSTIGELNITTILWGMLVLFEEKISEKTLTLENVNSILTKQKKFRLKKIRRGAKSPALKKLKNPTPNEKILALIREVGADEDYCGGTGVAAYVDHDLFEKNGITINVQDWKCKEYPQQFMKQQGFIPNLSILDLLFNVSPAEALKILS